MTAVAAPFPVSALLDRSSLAGLALAKLFGLAVEHGKPIVTAEALRQVRVIIDKRVDNVVENDKRDGWSNTHVADPLNDFAGDALSKRIDNFCFLFGKALPGKITDFVRDAVSPVITPAIRALVDETVTGEALARLVADALYEEARRLAEAV